MSPRDHAMEPIVWNAQGPATSSAELAKSDAEVAPGLIPFERFDPRAR